MRGERDFAAYVEARGPTLVRCLESRGLDPTDAETAAAETFADLHTDWAELVHAGGVDAALFRPGEVEALLAEPAPLPARAFPYDRVAAALTHRRRRRWRVGGGLTGALVAVLVGATLATVSADPPARRPDRLGPAPATAAVHDQGVVWWADGTLHLPTADVVVGDVRRVVPAAGSAAYQDGRGRLVAVDPDGRRTVIGRPTSGSPLVSSTHGLVAWVDAGRAGVQRLVVWDVPAHRQVAGVVVSGLHTAPTGFDGDWLRFRTGTTDFVWNPRGGDPVRAGDGRPRADGDEATTLVDAVAGSRLEQVGLTLRVVRTRTGRMTYFPGLVDGALSPDGRRLVARPIGGRPRLLDARTGEQLDTWYPGAWHVRDATFTADGRVAWLVDRDEGSPVLVVCGSPGEPMDCDPAEDLHATGHPLLARDSTS